MPHKFGIEVEFDDEDKEFCEELADKICRDLLTRGVVSTITATAVVKGEIDKEDGNES